MEDDSGQTTQGHSLQNDKKKTKNNACMTAVAMAALSGLRYYNLGYGERTQKSSCGNVWQLSSSSTTIGAGGMIATGGHGGSSAGMSAGSSAGSMNSMAGANSSLRCMNSSGSISSCTDSQMSAATDGGLLTNSGLGQAAAPLAQQLWDNGLSHAVDSGASPAQAMGGALSGMGDLGSALTKVAQTAYDHAQELGEVAAVSPARAGGGGGGSASDAGGGLNALFSAGAGATHAAPALEVFRGEGQSTDIWHSRTDQNLFQIVSGRIGKVSPRVR
jgi:hypothetical protein